MLLKILVLLLPWPAKRFILNKWYGFEIHPTAHIGLAWIYPSKLIMREGSRIGHFTVAINLDLLSLAMKAKIGRSNWITGYSTKTQSKHFNHQINRASELIIGEFSAITKNHHIDATSKIEIGRFVTIAGYNSQLLTHSIDIFHSRQDSLPITIGDYAFVSTNVVILGGSVLPSYSVLGAKALLNKSFDQQRTMYGGVPAKAIKPISPEAKYFLRKEGFVN